MLIPTMTDGNPTGGTGRGTQNRDRHRAHVASDLDAGDAEASGHSHRAVVDGREELRRLAQFTECKLAIDGSADELIG